MGSMASIPAAGAAAAAELGEDDAAAAKRRRTVVSDETAVQTAVPLVDAAALTHKVAVLEAAVAS